MEQKFGINSLDLQVLREFCEHEGKMVKYRKGDQLEREGDPSRWFAFVTEGCFKYVRYGVSDDKAHITWFSFEGEFVCDYPYCLDGDVSEVSIEADMPCEVRIISGRELQALFDSDPKMMLQTCGY
ncbi:MAG: cyclic nucleotide-binding domain-containing protein [Bacteroidaceae bacterium]|nr:cyclic nucleotide-binding domain-containing protein [Bacteroidaceae bacterium]